MYTVEGGAWRLFLHTMRMSYEGTNGKILPVSILNFETGPIPPERPAVGRRSTSRRVRYNDVHIPPLSKPTSDLRVDCNLTCPINRFAPEQQIIPLKRRLGQGDSERVSP